jgi:hypothetical protein
VKRHVLTWLAGWIAFFWLWQLLTGEWNHQEWVAGASAATVAATLGELARTLGDTRVRVPWRAVAASGNALPRVFVDFGIIMWALARRRGGRVHTRRTDVRDSGAWINYAAQFSPNAYVIDIDDEHVTLHDLVPKRKSESPA